MENALLAVIIVLSLLVLGLFAVVIVFLLKFLKMKEQEPKSLDQTLTGKKIPKEIRKAIDSAKSAAGQNLLGRVCVDHPELPAKGMCSISNEIYCELCLTKEKDVKIARKHLGLLLDHNWEHIYMVNTERTGADKINELMRIKKNLWKEQNIPVITQKQFKINIENDRIEDYTAVMAREEDIDLVKRTLNFLEADHDTASL